MIHTIGDSHSYFGWSDSVCKHHIGPVLCRSFGLDPHLRFDVTSFGIETGDSVVFCFGEIDCRCHVWKHSTDGVSHLETIDAIVSSYFSAIRATLSLLPPGVSALVLSVTPPVRESEIENNPNFPFLGTDSERLSYVRYFNECLNSYVWKQKHGQQSVEECEVCIGMVDVYDQYSDDSGFLNPFFSDGNVHIRDGIFLDEICREISTGESRSR